jgi:aminoglycoside phosphotransferase family enzyme/predicted kinase
METLLATWECSLLASGFSLIETHLSRVFLGGHDVYKLKRAVNLGFVDFREPSARARACHAEVELNRRLAPGVYLGVLRLRVAADGTPRLEPELSDAAGSSDDQAERIVHMRRLPDPTRADVLLRAGQLGDDDVERIARMLAGFHASVRADAETAAFGASTLIAGNVEENFAQVASTIDTYLSPDESAQLRRFQRDFLREHAELFRARQLAARVRDGHGDLRLEHLYRAQDGSFVAIDCIEFNERFRFADVASDLAFLVMDLDHHQATRLAERLVHIYARESQDYQLYRLLDFYVSYRAVVRAKVTSMLAEDPEVSASTRDRARAEARRYYLLALSAAAAPTVRPCAIAVCGGIAAGKSSLAEGLSRLEGVPVLSADRVRKQLLGLPATTPRHEASFQGAYSEATSERVYSELFARAEQVLASGRSVIVDASFRAAALRQGFVELSGRHGAAPLFVECTCSRELVEDRLRERAQGPSISDGRLAIYDGFVARFEPLDELGPGQHLRVDTSAPLEHSLAAVRERLQSS